MRSNSSRYAIIAIIGGFVLLFICVCMISSGIAAGALLRGSLSGELDSQLFSFSPTSTPQVLRPTESSQPDGVGAHILQPVTHETLNTLQEVKVPLNDLRDLSQRLEGIEDIPLTVEPPAGEFVIGTQQPFWISNVDTNEKFQVSATLRYVSPHVYFWIQDGVEFEEEALINIADSFESEIYPLTRDFFGTEWSPGVDGDPHIYILYVSGVGNSLAGYFSSSDENHPLTHEYSNAHEMFILNADNVSLEEENTSGVLAHEFQHMIHWNQDRNETSWINEGFSELATFLNGFEVGSDYSYTRDPDIQLNDWPNDESSTLPHYGAGFLFLDYFLTRFGKEHTQTLVLHPSDGLDSIDQVLEQIAVKDKLTGIPIGTDDLIQDWLLASFIGDGRVGDGRFHYSNYPEAPKAGVTETVKRCPADWQTREVSQFAADYIRIRCRGSHTLVFEGSTLAKVVPEDAFSGKYAFWSNKGDEADMTFTRTFDFSQHTGPLTLDYRIWFDLEEDYDYAYVEVSTDGENWEILTTPSGTAEDPSGNSYGWGYNGKSPGWLHERIDLSQYAGRKVWVRFEYVTDAAVNGEGILIDDIAIPEAGYFSDFEEDAGGWEAAGWARIWNVLPQTFRLAIISRGDQTTVSYIPVAADSSVEVPLEIGGEVKDVILVVIGTTRNTRQKAAYRFALEP